MAVGCRVITRLHRMMNSRLILSRRRTLGRGRILSRRRALRRRRAHVRHTVSHSVAMVGHGQQETTFQIFDRDRKLDATA